MPFRPLPFPALLALVLALPVAPAAAQSTVRAEGNALEFRTDLPWARLQLIGNEEISGVSPLRIPGPLTGDYWLRASGDGVETQFGRVRIRLDEQGTRIVSYGRGSLKITLLQTLYPGVAQYRSEQKTKGLLMGITGFFALNTYVWAQTEVWDAERAVTDAERNLDRAQTPLGQQIARTQLDLAREGSTYAADRRNLALLAVGVVWGVSAIDALVFRPDFDVAQADEGSLSLRMKPVRRFDASIRSLVFPGLGQEYNGQARKGFFVACGGIALGSWLLRTQDRYNAAATDYEEALIRFDGVLSPEDRLRIGSSLDTLSDDVDEKEHVRNIAMAVTAGYWLVNIVDAAFFYGSPWGESETSPGGFGLNLDPVRGTLAARVDF